MKMLFGFFVIALLVGIGQVTAQANQQQSTRDQLRAAVQEICPMSGKQLGDHGTPIKARIGQETVFLCCKGCLKKKVDAKHWATIHANIASAQAKCPVMDKALPKSPKQTIVEGQVIYLCCPACSKKVAADPKTYLQKVDDLYTASLNAK